MVADKRLFPLGHTSGFLTATTDVQVKFYGPDRKLIVADEAKIEQVKETFCLKLANDVLAAAVRRLADSEYLLVVFEGTAERASVLLCFAGRDDRVFEVLEEQNPALRLAACDLPPGESTVVDVPDRKSVV